MGSARGCELPRPSAPAGPGAPGAPARRGRRGARDRRRDAGGQRPGRRPGARPGPEEGGRSCPCRGRRQCWPRSPATASPGRGGRSRASCPAAGASAASASRGIGADERGAVLFEAPGRVAATLRDLAAACGEDAARRGVPRAHEAARAIVRGTLGRAGRGRVRRVDPGARGVRAGRGTGRRPAPIGEKPRTGEAAKLEAAMAEVERLVAAGTARGDAAAARWPRRRASLDGGCTGWSSAPDPVAPRALVVGGPRLVPRWENDYTFNPTGNVPFTLPAHGQPQFVATAREG